MTAPDETAKSSELNDATPLFDVVASSPAIVIKLPVTVVSTPSPPTILNSSPKLMSNVLDDSSPIVNVEFANLAFVTAPSLILAVITAFDAISSATTPPDFIVTAPDDTAKLSLENDATPLLDVVASSPENVIVPELSPTSIPSPAANVNVPPNEMSVLVEPSVTLIDEFESLALAIEPANSALATPPSFMVTAPDDTAKLSLENDATPLLDVVASSPAIVNKLPVIVVSTPSPPTTLNSSPKLISKVLELSSPMVIDEFTNSTLATPLSFIVTAPDDTAKLSELNEATPLLDVVASSPAIVIASSETVVSIPSPPVNVKVLPVEKLSFEPLSAASVKLVSIETEPPNDTPEPFMVIDELESLALAIEPANCVFVIPLALTVTAPEDTAKSSELNEAIPLLEVVASSPAIDNRLPVTVVSMPSPPIILNSSPNEMSNVLDDSSPIVIEEFDNELLPIFDKVLLLALITLFVNV